jgi:hypothetical protein
VLVALPSPSSLISSTSSLGLKSRLFSFAPRLAGIDGAIFVRFGRGIAAAVYLIEDLYYFHECVVPYGVMWLRFILQK